MNARLPRASRAYAAPPLSSIHTGLRLLYGQAPRTERLRQRLFRVATVKDDRRKICGCLRRILKPFPTGAWFTAEAIHRRRGDLALEVTGCEFGGPVYLVRPQLCAVELPLTRSDDAEWHRSVTTGWKDNLGVEGLRNKPSSPGGNDQATCDLSSSPNSPSSCSGRRRSPAA